MPPPSTTLRPISEADHAFLYEVYASTRVEELAITGWTDAQKSAFLQMQFTAQHRFYQDNYTATTYSVIEHAGVAIGRLYVRRLPDELRIVDIAILPTHRGRGIGSALIHELIAESTQANAPLRIHVEKNNPALQLYQRLGFRAIADKGVYWFLERAPG